MSQSPPREGAGTFLTTEDLAARWFTTPRAIHTMRHRGHAPKAVRIGKRNLYRIADVVAFEATREQA